ncbi:hypothetical protein [Acrocarpospora corrugata]|uniref:hypothetical protein n=1 Tax=Acrocarpospora corrugata TaxID=35763 RepID=UPI001C3F9A5D|nr:hypothetical protein [Acrocarpospora corrugata]
MQLGFFDDLQGGAAWRRDGVDGTLHEDRQQLGDPRTGVGQIDLESATPDRSEDDRVDAIVVIGDTEFPAREVLGEIVVDLVGQRASAPDRIAGQDVQGRFPAASYDGRGTGPESIHPLWPLPVRPEVTNVIELCSHHSHRLDEADEIHIIERPVHHVGVDVIAQQRPVVVADGGHKPTEGEKPLPYLTFVRHRVHVPDSEIMLLRPVFVCLSRRIGQPLHPR